MPGQACYAGFYGFALILETGMTFPGHKYVLTNVKAMSQHGT